MALMAAVLLTTGCAFDVSFVKLQPATFTARPDCSSAWTLLENESIALGTGFPTRLRQATRWHCVGVVEAGTVFRTDDQIVTVEASNIYEAMAVMNGNQLVGFYLPVDRKIAPVTPAVPLRIKESTS